MLLPNHRIAIETTVTAGKPLPADLAGALWAALAQAETAHTNCLDQMETLRADNVRLLCERDSTLELRRNLEAAIDRRVKLRTENLERQAAELRQQAAASGTQKEETELRAQRKSEEFYHHEAVLVSLTRELRALVEQRVSPSWLSRLWWKKRAKDVLQKSEHELWKMELPS